MSESEAQTSRQIVSRSPLKFAHFPGRVANVDLAGALRFRDDLAGGGGESNKVVACSKDLAIPIAALDW